jgi:hypothetical protein
MQLKTTKKTLDIYPCSERIQTHDPSVEVVQLSTVIRADALKNGQAESTVYSQHVQYMKTILNFPSDNESEENKLDPFKSISNICEVRDHCGEVMGRVVVPVPDHSLWDIT